jgi:hypothetical protein
MVFGGKVLDSDIDKVLLQCARGRLQGVCPDLEGNVSGIASDSAHERIVSHSIYLAHRLSYQWIKSS